MVRKERNEIKSSAHSRYRCQYHIVFAPKYRRQAIYGEIKKDIGEILRKLCEQKGVEIIEEIVRTKGSRNNRGRSVSGSYTYVGKYSTAYKYSTIYGISQGEKFTNDF